MNKQLTAAGFAFVSGLALAGCSSPTSPAEGASIDGAAMGGDYTPSMGSFALIRTPSSNGVAAVNTCNLDAVNNKPAGNEPLPRGSIAIFSGWAADAQSNGIPAGVRLVLEGAQDYAVNAATGLPRVDVAKANGRPAWAAAGYTVTADLSAVPSGIYTPVLEFSVNGKQMRCATRHRLKIQ